MSSAQLEPRPEFPDDDILGPDPTLFALQDPKALKEQVAARLAAHRARRQRKSPAPLAPTPITTPSRARTARIAATVAERYSHSESYRSFLAAEAESAIRQAEAAAHIAAVNALAVTAAQLDLLEELEQLPTAESSRTTTNPGAPCLDSETWVTKPSEATAPKSKSAATPNQQQAASNQQPALTIRLYEDPLPTGNQQPTTSNRLTDLIDPETEHALDAEIAYRHTPTFADQVPPAEIPANLLEFPRQLVAARRARPRLAEGPLREEEEHKPDSAQLRIFEVEPAQLSPAPAVESAAPEWTSIMLDAQPVVEPSRESTLVQAVEPEYFAPNAAPLLLTAPLELRIMAAAVDTCIVLAALLSCCAAAVFTIGAPLNNSPLASLHLAPHLNLAGPAFLTGPINFLAQAIPAAIAGTVAFLILTTLYQLLFFTFSNATPGMNYARIGLCTFSDENPTRAQMRRRALAFLLSAIPLGLGLLWSWIDSDRLGWHDRLSRMYQRSY
jgi:uncharacterized RDD family membrane protein YckC